MIRWSIRWDAEDRSAATTPDRGRYTLLGFDLDALHGLAADITAAKPVTLP